MNPTGRAEMEAEALEGEPSMGGAPRNSRGDGGKGTCSGTAAPSEHIRRPSSGLNVQIAATTSQLRAAYALVYDCYQAKGYIHSNRAGVVYQTAFALPSSRTIIAQQEGGATVGTLTVVGDNPLGLHIEATYPKEVQSLRDRQRSIGEVTCLAIRSTPQHKGTEIFFAITHFMIQLAFSRRYDDLLIAINPRHFRFYRRLFQVTPLGPCRPYGFVKGNPAIACRMDLHEVKRKMAQDLMHQYVAQGIPEPAQLWPSIDSAGHRLLFWSRMAFAQDSHSNGGGYKMAA